MKTKIQTSDGRYTIIAVRSEEENFGCEIKHISNTNEQPYIAVNHTAEGKPVGGKTMTEMEVQNLIKFAKEKNLVVEEF